MGSLKLKLLNKESNCHFTLSTFRGKRSVTTIIPAAIRVKPIKNCISIDSPNNDYQNRAPSRGLIAPCINRSRGFNKLWK